MLITEGSKLGSFWALARGNPVVSFNLIAFWPLVLRLQRAGDHDPQENWCRDSVGGQHRKACDRHRGCSDHPGGEPLPIEARRQPHLHRRCLPVLDYRRPREEEVRHTPSLLCPPSPLPQHLWRGPKWSAEQLRCTITKSTYARRTSALGTPFLTG